MASSSSSRHAGRGAPTAATRAPRLSQAPFSTGSRAVVTVQTMSAPRVASSALMQATPFTSLAHFATLSGLRLQTRISDTGRTLRNAAAWVRASTPLPRRATTLGEPEVRQSTATAEAAAVRSAVGQVASRTARVRPVVASMSTMVACIVGRPRRALPGIWVISLVARMPPTSAGFRKNTPSSGGISITLRSGCTTRRAEKSISASRTAAMSASRPSRRRTSASERCTVMVESAFYARGYRRPWRRDRRYLRGIAPAEARPRGGPSRPPRRRRGDFVRQRRPDSARRRVPLRLSARLWRASPLWLQPDHRRLLPPERAAEARAVPAAVLALLAPRPPCGGGAALFEADRALRERARNPRRGSGGWRIPAPHRLAQGVPHRARARPAPRGGRAVEARVRHRLSRRRRAHAARARAARRARAGRRAALDRAVERRRPARARARLPRRVRAPRRAIRPGQCGEPRSGWRRLAPAQR